MRQKITAVHSEIFRVCPHLARLSPPVETVEEMREWLVDAQKQQPREAWPLIERAELAHVVLDYASECATWEELRSGFPAIPIAYQKGIAALRVMADFDGASRLAALCSEKFPREIWPLSQMAAHHAHLGRHQSACACWEKIRKLFPDREDGYKGGISAYRAMTDYDSAEALLKETEGRFEQRLWHEQERAELLTASCRHSESAAAWRQMCEKHPDQPPVHKQAIAFKKKIKDFFGAERLAQDAEHLFPGAPWVLEELADVALARGDYETASERWEAVRRNDPQSTRGLSRGAWTCALRGDDGMMEYLLDMLEEHHPYKPAGISTRIQIQQHRKNWDASLSLAEFMFGKFPHILLGYTAGIDAACIQGRMDTASNILVRMHPHFGHSVEYVVRMARVQRLCGDLDGAASTLDGFHKDKGSFFDYTSQFFVEINTHLDDRLAHKRFDAIAGSLFAILLDEPTYLNNSAVAHRFMNTSTATMTRLLYTSAMRKQVCAIVDETIHLAIVGGKIRRDAHEYFTLLFNLEDDVEARNSLVRRLITSLPADKLVPLLVEMMAYDRKMVNMLEAEVDKIPVDDDHGPLLFACAIVLSNYDDKNAFLFISRVAKNLDGQSFDPASPLGTLLEMHRSRQEALCRVARRKTSRREKIRIAVCVAGQLRGFEAAFPTWEQFGFSGHEVEYFVHTWVNTGKRYPYPQQHAPRVFRGNFLQAFLQLPQTAATPVELERIYPSFHRLLERGSCVKRETLKKVYGTDHIVIDDESNPLFTGFTNLMKMHYKAQQCYRLVENSGGKFDLVMKIRPDIAVRHFSSRLDWRELCVRSQSDFSVFADLTRRAYGDYREKKPFDRYPNLAIYVGEVLAIGTPDAMKEYCATYSNVQSNRFRTRRYKIMDEFMGHVTLGASLFCGGVMTREVGEFHCDYLEADMPTTLSLYEALIADCASREALPYDAALLRAIEADMKEEEENI